MLDTYSACDGCIFIIFGSSQMAENYRFHKFYETIDYFTMFIFRGIKKIIFIKLLFYNTIKFCIE